MMLKWLKLFLFLNTLLGTSFFCFGAAGQSEKGGSLPKLTPDEMSDLDSDFKEGTWKRNRYDLFRDLFFKSIKGDNKEKIKAQIEMNYVLETYPRYNRLRMEIEEYFKDYINQISPDYFNHRTEVQPVVFNHRTEVQPVVASPMASYGGAESSYVPTIAASSPLPNTFCQDYHGKTGCQAVPGRNSTGFTSVSSEFSSLTLVERSDIGVVTMTTQGERGSEESVSRKRKRHEVEEELSEKAVRAIQTNNKIPLNVVIKDRFFKKPERSSDYMEYDDINGFHGSDNGVVVEAAINILKVCRTMLKGRGVDFIIESRGNDFQSYLYNRFFGEVDDVGLPSGYSGITKEFVSIALSYSIFANSNAIIHVIPYLAEGVGEIRWLALVKIGEDFQAVFLGKVFTGNNEGWTLTTLTEEELSSFADVNSSDPIYIISFSKTGVPSSLY